MSDRAMSDQEAGQLLQRVSARTVAIEGKPTKDELCKVYKEVKPLVQDVLPWIEKLPHGKEIANAIRFLMKIADTLCP